MNDVILYRIDPASICTATTGWTCSLIYSDNGASCANGAASAAPGQTRSLSPVPTSQEAEAAPERQRSVKERRGYAKGA